MKPSKLRKLVVDANPILSAVLQGSAYELVHDPTLELYTTEHTVREVIEYIPRLAEKPQFKKSNLTPADMYFALVTAPLTIHGPSFYEAKLEEAKRRIGQRDPEDVDLLALALKLKLPIWSNDQDYQAAKVEWYTTAQLLKRLKSRN